MTIVEFLLLLLVAGVCGGLGQAIAGFSRGGFLVAIAVGMIGAYFGLWLARRLSLPEPLMLHLGDSNYPVMWSIIGSILLVALVSLITPGRRRALTAR